MQLIFTNGSLDLPEEFHSRIGLIQDLKRETGTVSDITVAFPVEDGKLLLRLLEAKNHLTIIKQQTLETLTATYLDLCNYLMIDIKDPVLDKVLDYVHEFMHVIATVEIAYNCMDLYNREISSYKDGKISTLSKIREILNLDCEDNHSRYKKISKWVRDGPSLKPYDLNFTCSEKPLIWSKDTLLLMDNWARRQKYCFASNFIHLLLAVYPPYEDYFDKHEIKMLTDRDYFMSNVTDFDLLGCEDGDGDELTDLAMSGNINLIIKAIETKRVRSEEIYTSDVVNLLLQDSYFDELKVMTRNAKLFPCFKEVINHILSGIECDNGVRVPMEDEDDTDMTVLCGNVMKGKFYICDKSHTTVTNETYSKLLEEINLILNKK